VNRERIFAIFGKDLRDAMRDTRLILALLMPLGLGLLYSLMFSDDMRPQADVGSVSAAASVLPVALQEAAADAVTVRLREAADESELRRLVREEEIDIGLVIPAGFDEALERGESPPLTAVLPSSPTFGADYVAALLEPVTQQLAGQEPAAAIDRVALEPARGSTAAALLALGQRRVFVLISLILMLVMIAAYALPSTVTEETEKRTLDALTLISSHVEVIAAKALFGLTYCAIALPLMLVVTRERPTGVALFVAGMGLSSVVLVGIGLFFGGLIKTQSQLNNWSSVLVLPLLAPSVTIGLPTPEWVNAVLYVLPTTHTMRLGVNAFAGRAVFEEMWMSFAILAAWAAVAYGLVWWRLTRREAA
jgi:hypothetical protein